MEIKSKKEFKKTKLGEVPVDWKEVLFEDLFEEVVEYTNNISQYPLYSLTIENGVTPKTERYERSFLITKDSNNYKVVKKDEFVYNPMNLRFGALARLEEDKKVSVSGYYNVFKVKSKYSPQFIEYFLKSERMMYLYNSYATGSLKEKQRVHYSQFIQFKLPMPNIEEANKIASILSTWDKAIDLKKELIEKKIEQKKSLMQKLLSGEVRLPGFKGDWGSLPIKELASEKFTDGDWIETPYITNKGIYLIQTGNIGIGEFIEKNEKKFITEKSFKELNCTEVKPGDLLICRLADPIGRSCIVPDTGYKMITSVDVTILGINQEVALTEFVNYQLCVPKNLYRMDILGAGSTRKRISRKNLGKVEILLPKLEEQKAIVDLLSTIDKEIELNKKELFELNKQKKGLMQLLLTGKIRVKV